MCTVKVLSFLTLVFSFVIPHSAASVIKRTPAGSAISCSSPIEQGLGQQLSSGASISLPGSQAFTNANIRWSSAEHPDFAVVVTPANTQDVVAAVNYANACNYPFLAVNRGHGTAISLNNVHHGININIRNLTSVTFAPDGNSITAGGGVFADQVIRNLAARGKVAATGACACVGGLGTGLGGGFGRVQGFYGLVADNFLEMTVVTADGSTVTANNQQNSNLFWALRGAGHNFGIVTSFSTKIYPLIPNWYAALYIFTRDQLDPVFQLLNRYNANGAQAKELLTYTLITLNPAISRDPVIIVSIQYAGPEADALKYAQPFVDLHPIVVNNQTIPYAELADAVGTGLNSPACVEGGSSKATFPVGALSFNLTTIHQIYDLYSELVTRYPDFSESVIQFESESMLQVRKLGDEDTAYAHRGDNILFALLTQYTSPTANDAIGPQYGRRFRSIVIAGDGPGRRLNAYVNYAYGDETVEQIYGYEDSRLQRLLALKRQYDPQGKFDFFNPIIPINRKR
ncbi:MAG: hypothetical protein L6R37_007565 [Teloschistes peruensis]|nr:MAG: hypothetical protein L6R37_007565 [Teloschistes peruensis]